MWQSTYERMTYKTGNRHSLGCAFLAAALSLVAIILTPIGPIFIYGWLVPIISPVIPKPDSVPPRASAEYHWKGFGLIWYWEEPVTGGCARWWAAKDSDELVLGLEVFEGGGRCKDGERTMNRLSFQDHTTFGSGENPSDSRKCSFKLSAAMISRYREQVDGLISTNSRKIAMDMLQSTRAELHRIDRVGLQAEQYGCSVGKV
jgi:hypothetical protein